MRRVGVDTNVFIHAHLPSSPEHERVRAQLLALLASPDTCICTTPSILHEFVHVVTDAKRFAPPVSMAEAIALARRYLTASNVECLAADGQSAELALELMEQHQLGRERLADSMFAATLMRHAVNELVTCNVDDFKIFAGLAVIDPRT